MTILALGDSTTAGNPAYLSPAEAPPSGRGDERSQYAYWMRQAHPEWEVVNLGVGGERSDEIARRLVPALERWKPELLVLLAGVNDIYQGRSVRSVQENLRGMYETASAKGVRVMACTILPYDNATQQKSERIRQVNDWIRKYALEKGHLFCDTSAAAADPSFPQRLLSDTPDGLHPGLDGYRSMARAITEAIEKG